MRVLIHIGTHKTGSTLIQNVCKSLHADLKKQGVYYPVEGYSQAGHHELAWALMKGDASTAAQYVEGAVSKASGCHTLIFSSEEFEFLRNFKLLSELLADYEVDVICYFRRQDKYLESEYNQHVKMMDTRFCSDIFKFYMYHDFHRRFNYVALVSGWDKSGLINRFHVLSYDREAKRDYLLGSFFDCIGVGLDVVGEGLTTTRANKSVSPSSLIYLARLNELNGVDPERRNRFISAVSNKIASHKENLSSKKECFLSPEYAQRLVKRFDGSNKKLAKRFCNGRELFEMSFVESNDVIDFYHDFDSALYSEVLGELGLNE